MKLTGVVLAGGKSSRFGSDKALAGFCGTTMLARACGLLSGLCDEVVISGRTPSGQIDGFPYIADISPGGGPMSGLTTVIRELNTDRLVVIPCDMPLLRSGAISKAIEQSTLTSRSCVYRRRDGRIQPFPMVLNRHDALQSIDAFANGGKVRDFLATIPLSIIDIADDDEPQFCNINTQAQLQAICHNK